MAHDAVFEVYNQIILKSEVIGISSLYAKATSDPAMWSLYGAKQLYFNVYTKQNTIKIESDYFKINSVDDKEALSERKEYNNWADIYHLFRDQVKELLCQRK